MLKSIVRKAAYKSLPQNALPNFAMNVHNRMVGKAAYASFATEITQLEEKSEAYKIALVKAAKGGTDLVAMKDAAKKDLLLALDRIAFQLNYHYNNEPTFIINTGMDMVRERKTIRLGLEAPYQFQVINKGVKGELKLSFKLPDAARVTNNSIEYSLDNGQNWNNGIYTSRSSITLRDLPSRQSVLFRVRSMGTFERKSPWTEAVEGFVL